MATEPIIFLLTMLHYSTLNYIVLCNASESLYTKCSQCEYANYSHQMPDFSFKLHQIQCRLRLRPDPDGGAYSAPPDPLAGFGEGEREDEGQGRKKEIKENGKGKWGKGGRENDE